jgi:uncharacterized protein YbdZ (MbtH family)
MCPGWDIVGAKRLRPLCADFVEKLVVIGGGS